MKSYLCIVSCPITKKDVREYVIKSHYLWDAEIKAKRLFENDNRYVPQLKKHKFELNKMIWDSVEI